MNNTEGIGITINTPDAGGIFANGALAALGSVLSYFFVALMVIWVVYSIYAAYKILLSQGNDKDIQTGYTLIKNVWISITWGMIFFVAVSIIGSFSGIGDITQWYYQLAQCNGSGGSFYFQDLAAQQIAEVPTEQMYCCKVKQDLRSAPTPYSKLRFKENTYHYIGVASGGTPSSTHFSECVLFK